METDFKKEFLSNKNILLSAPGVLLSDNYYDMYSHTSSMIETTWGTGKNVQSLPSLAFGTTTNINVPNGSFMAETYLRLVIELANPANANVTLTAGWGWACIAEIQYLLGSSNASMTTISGEALFTQAMGQCPTAEKRSEIFRLGGEPQGVGPAASFGRFEANILIPLPYSSLCEKKGIDTKMLTSNIILTIKFKPNTAIFGGSGVKPTAFTSAQLYYRQGDLSNANQSLSIPMRMDSELIYSYPFLHAQPIVASPFQGVTEADSSNGTLINLTGFINSDLVGIAFYVVDELDVLQSANRSPNPFNCVDVQNIVMRYNGNIIYSAPGSSYRLINMTGSQSASYFANSIIQPKNGGVAPFAVEPKNCYICWVDFAKIREACVNGEHFANTFRVSNQTLTINLNTPESNDHNYRLYGVYLYNGIVAFKGGMTFLYYD